MNKQHSNWRKVSDL